MFIHRRPTDYAYMLYTIVNHVSDGNFPNGPGGLLGPNVCSLLLYLQHPQRQTGTTNMLFDRRSADDASMLYAIDNHVSDGTFRTAIGGLRGRTC